MKITLKPYPNGFVLRRDAQSWRIVGTARKFRKD